MPSGLDVTPASSQNKCLKWGVERALTDQTRSPCNPPILYALSFHEFLVPWFVSLRAELTGQFLFQVLVVFVAVSILRDQSAGLGITCLLREFLFQAASRGPKYLYATSRKPRSAAVPLFTWSGVKTYLHLMSGILKSLTLARSQKPQNGILTRIPTLFRLRNDLRIVDMALVLQWLWTLKESGGPSRQRATGSLKPD